MECNDLECRDCNPNFHDCDVPSNPKLGDKFTCECGKEWWTEEASRYGDVGKKPFVTARGWELIGKDYLVYWSTKR